MAGHAKVWFKTWSRICESWRILKAGAMSAAEWLDGEEEGPLAADVASAGQDLASGNLRSSILEHRERIMGRLLEEGISRHPDRTGAGHNEKSCPANGSSFSPRGVQHLLRPNSPTRLVKTGAGQETSAVGA